MRIMIDTNVLISIIFFPSKQMDDIKTALCNDHKIVLCSHVLAELQTVTQRKFPHKLKALDDFLINLPFEQKFRWVARLFKIDRLEIVLRL